MAKDKTLENTIESPGRRVLLAGIGALSGLAILRVLTGCGDDSGNGNPDSGVDSGVDPNGPLSAIDTSSLNPSNGAKYTASDSPLEVGLDLPSLNPKYTGSAPSGVDVVVTASGSGWNAKVLDKTGQPLGQYVSGSLDLLTANNGGEVPSGDFSIDYKVSAQDGSGKTQTVTAKVTCSYEGTPTDRPYVKSFRVNKANVGTAIGIDCYGEDPTGGSILGNWNLQTDLSG
ncbi:hypothetical protein KY363_07745, partial [Candidatus Woesearchaeota archaeon]|nr:hypothetical protein [Candidatus Woesearchaeota archaeon]